MKFTTITLTAAIAIASSSGVFAAGVGTAPKGVTAPSHATAPHPTTAAPVGTGTGVTTGMGGGAAGTTTTPTMPSAPTNCPATVQNSPGVGSRPGC